MLSDVRAEYDVRADYDVRAEYDSDLSQIDHLNHYYEVEMWLWHPIRMLRQGYRLKDTIILEIDPAQYLTTITEYTAKGYLPTNYPIVTNATVLQVMCLWIGPR